MDLSLAGKNIKFIIKNPQERFQYQVMEITVATACLLLHANIGITFAIAVLTRLIRCRDKIFRLQILQEKNTTHDAGNSHT
jgi:hypothetical protein